MAKKICAALFALILIASLLSVSAAEANISYAYWTDISGGRRAVSSKAMYQVKTELTASKLGVAQFGELSDVCTDKDGNVYVLDGKNSKITVFFMPNYCHLMVNMVIYGISKRKRKDEKR